MKIGFLIIDFSLGRGGERVTITLANELCKSAEIHLVSMYQLNAEPFFAVDPAVIVHVISPGPDRPAFIRRKWTEARGVYRHIREERYDAVIGVASYASILLGMMARWIKGPAFIAWEHSNYYALSRPWRIIRNRVYPALDSLVCLVPDDKETFDRKLKNVRVISNPLSFTSDEKSSLGNKRIISAGALEHEKGFDQLIAAFEEISRSCPEWKLNIFGEGSLKSELEALIRKLNLQDTAKIFPPTKRLKDEMLGSALYIMPSRREGFGMVLIEAMECGLACVSFDCPTGPGNIIIHGKNGILVAPGDTGSLADETVRLIGDPVKMRELAGNGTASVRRFYKEEIANEWLNFIGKIIKL